MRLDGLPVRRSCQVQRFVAEQGAGLQVERLPAYAPELNPVEYLGGYRALPTTDRDLVPFAITPGGALVTPTHLPKSTLREPLLVWSAPLPWQVPHRNIESPSSTKSRTPQTRALRAPSRARKDADHRSGGPRYPSGR